MDKKKTLILSILGVIVLVIAVVGISYAMYAFTGTGSKENVITTGKISISVDETTGDNTTLTLENSYPTSDATGSSASNPEKLQFTVKGELPAANATPINYDVQLQVTTDSVVGGLKDRHVSFTLSKNGTQTIAAKPLSDYATTNGTIITSGGYVVASGTVTTGILNDVYVLRAWVNDTYNLPTTGTGTCAGGTAPTTEAACNNIYGIWDETTCQLKDRTACEGAGGTWTDTTENVHSNQTAASTLKIKVVIVAKG